LYSIDKDFVKLVMEKEEKTSKFAQDVKEKKWLQKWFN